jgi:ppGpp synthetase/RelA/SpoT-type nucleotidyltranferase
MAKAISKTQIDRLGDRLKKGDISEADLRLLDLYRRSFSDAYEVVVGKIRKNLSLEPTGRPAKSTTSIIEKLRRESIRLTQIQDIAGGRLTVSTIVEQDNVVRGLTDCFERTHIVDRRQQPSYGYRAVHVVVDQDGKLIEIQVRTVLQHLWAELSEKVSDIIDPALKYGGGEADTRSMLMEFSSLVANNESDETQLTEIQTGIQSIVQRGFSHEIQQQLIELRSNLATWQEKLEFSKQKLSGLLRYTIESVK